jgi:cytochrome oxidase assembly protein ShyY1
MVRHFLRPRWIAFHLLVLFAVVGMIYLAFWQVDRLNERRAFNDAVSSRTRAEPVLVDQTLPPSTNIDADELEWTPVLAAGTYLVDEQIIVVNRSQDGIAGQNVVTPLQLADGRLVLVNRGFVPLAAEIPAATDEPVTVRGLLRTSQGRGFGGARDPSTGPLVEVQRIDIPRLTQQLPADVLPMWISLEVSDPDQGTRWRRYHGPALSSGSHLSYAVQWAIFAVCVAIGWVLAISRSARTYRERLQAEQAAERPEPAEVG